MRPEDRTPRCDYCHSEVSSVRELLGYGLALCVTCWGQLQLGVLALQRRPDGHARLVPRQLYYDNARRRSRKK